MKTFKNTTLIAATAFFVFLSSFAYAGAGTTGTSEAKIGAVAYATEAELFAESAALTMSNDDFASALQWINKSIETEATVENLEMKGDMLSAHHLNESATKYYVQAIVKAKELNPTAENERLQTKIWANR